MAVRWAPTENEKQSRMGSGRRTAEKEMKEAIDTLNEISWLAQD